MLFIRARKVPPIRVMNGVEARSPGILRTIPGPHPRVTKQRVTILPDRAMRKHRLNHPPKEYSARKAAVKEVVAADKAPVKAEARVAAANR